MIQITSKGSRNNPYSFSEYYYMPVNQWNGGYVNMTSDDNSVCFIDRSGTSYNASVYGQYGHPYEEEIFTQIRQLGIWPGGYAYVGQTIYYITRGNSRYQEDCENLGKSSHPCPYEIFEEMCDNGVWHGGWIEYENGVTAYGRSETLSTTAPGSGSTSGSSSSSGSSSGSGSGSNGSGCGCGSGVHREDDGGEVKKGSLIYGTFLMGSGKIKVSWGDGKPFVHPFSSVEASVEMQSHLVGIVLESSNLSANWEEPYQIVVRGTITLKLIGTSTRYYINMSMCRLSIPHYYWVNSDFSS